MVTQSRSHPVPLLLTRPRAQGADFAERLTARFGDQLAIVTTPLLAPRFFAPALPVGPFSALILTSQTGVEGYLRLGAASDLPKEVFCVGERTASAARGAELIPLCVAEDAASLIAQIKLRPPRGRLLHLRGREARGNIGELLQSAGIDTVDAVMYAQERLALTGAAATLLRGQAPVIVPLFSPRTAMIFVAEMARVKGISPLFVAAMSGEVALEARRFDAQVKIAQRPDAAAMVDVVAVFLTDLQHA
jgi:uroporphyrinogen-III synthase